MVMVIVTVIDLAMVMVTVIVMEVVIVIVVIVIVMVMVIVIVMVKVIVIAIAIAIVTVMVIYSLASRQRTAFCMSEEARTAAPPPDPGDLASLEAYISQEKSCNHDGLPCDCVHTFWDSLDVRPGIRAFAKGVSSTASLHTFNLQKFKARVSNPVLVPQITGLHSRSQQIQQFS